MDYMFTLRLTEGGRKFFGPGVLRLLERVESLGSLRSAASAMGMAYSKAWTIIRHAEEVLGFALIESKKGGKNGGGAVVTELGARFLGKYRDFDAQLRYTADKIFRDLFTEPEEEDGAEAPQSTAPPDAPPEDSERL